MALKETLRWESAGHPLHFGQQSGDASLVALFEGGALVAVVDGLGHGPGAAEAARLAVEILAATPARPLEVLMLSCHDALRRTRGAAMTLVQLSFEHSSLVWTAVGNVDAVLLRPTGLAERVMPRGGVVGHQMPPLRVDRFPLQARDYLVLATDGVRSELTLQLKWPDVSMDRVPQILNQFSKRTDDAHLLCVEYLGSVS